ncbi:GSCOCG00000276001-RA-CDS [Cotesia congregata]|nr:GSCOCG00000276001-RA-CDS [Cotesia congregata]
MYNIIYNNNNNNKKSNNEINTCAPQKGDSEAPSSRPLRISCFPTSLSPTRRNFKR